VARADIVGDVVTVTCPDALLRSVLPDPFPSAYVSSIVTCCGEATLGALRELGPQDFGAAVVRLASSPSYPLSGPVRQKAIATLVLAPSVGELRRLQEENLMVRRVREIQWLASARKLMLPAVVGPPAARHVC
jgi:hypothetical protein